MPLQEMLILAVTHMIGGVCTAGMTAEPDPVTGLRWVRPVRKRSHVLLGDITTAQGVVIRPFDVVQFDLDCPQPEPPHVEDCIAVFRRRPRIVRRLEGDRRAAFLQDHLDRAPCDVLTDQVRSLCLVRPDWLQCRFHRDHQSGKLDARISFGLDQQAYPGSGSGRGLPVTDLKWRALGHAWTRSNPKAVELSTGDLRDRLGAAEVFLAIGLSRAFQGDHWPIVIGVHTVPDYVADVDYREG